MVPISRRMRVSLIPVLVLATYVTAPVAAEEPADYVRQLRGADIPLPEAQFVLYQYVAGTGDVEPDERLQDQVRNRLDFGNARFFALLDHMHETVDASRKFTDAQNSALCARRDELTTVEALGAALNKSMEAVRAYQAKLMEGAREILGSEGEPKFAEVISEIRGRMVINRVDYTALLVARKIEADAALKDICRQAGEAAQPPARNP